MQLSSRALLLGSIALLLVGGAALADDPRSGGGPAPVLHMETPSAGLRQPLSDADSTALGQVLSAAKAGEASRLRAAMANLQDPLARKVALWALADTAPETMSYAELDGARRDLAGWPRAARRETAAERTLPDAGLSAQGIIAWFAGSPPQTPQGAMALASALQVTGDAPHAAELIRTFWRTRPFDADLQQQWLARFGAVLSSDDHAAREDMLLYGAQGQAARDLLPLISPDQQALAQARMAVRSGSSNAESLIAALPINLQTAPGLAYERVSGFERRGLVSDAIALVPYLPKTLPDEEFAGRMWKLRGALVSASLKAGDSRGAYLAAANSGLTNGGDAAEAEFYAGWLALTRLKDPALADTHFAKLQAIGASPITQSRALYWRGRAMEAAGDPVSAQIFYAEGGKYQTAFYGQLAAAKAGVKTLKLGHDPDITAADRVRFEGREPVRAAHMLAEIGAKDTFKSFTASIAETLPSAAEEALLVDLARGYGDQENSMRIVRNAAKRGFILPERGYPIRTPPAAEGGAEAPFVLGITRQESSFDPRARSGVGARGMMQLMPATAQTMARHIGLSYRSDQLDDPDYNMQLGSSYLGQLVNSFSGSYVMAAAGYNAGPGRPTAWVTMCGDPRSSSSDPLDFIECIPFKETRDYVMRVMEATQVYRARLNGGTAPMTLASDLKRGVYSYSAGTTSVVPLSNTLVRSGAPAGGQDQARR